MNTLTIAVLLVCATVAYAADGTWPGLDAAEGDDAVPGGYGAPLAADEDLKGAESKGFGYANPDGGHGHGGHGGHGGYGK